MRRNLRTYLALLVLGAALLTLALARTFKAPPPPSRPEAPAALSDVLRARRPAGGEYLGVYLLEKKIGYVFLDLGLVPGRTDRVRAVSELVFKAQVGLNTSERYFREERIYEAHPGGRLVSFTFTQRGDGGDQVLLGTASAQGVRVVQERPGRPDEVLQLPPVTEVVEDADSVRVALLRQASLAGRVLHALDLKSYQTTTTVQPPEERLVGGVRVKLGRAVTLSEKEKIPVTSYLDEEGRLLEQTLGEMMRARAEPEAVAKRMDLVEVFSLTRLPLPRLLPPEASNVPGQLVLVVEGLPEHLQLDTSRQRYQQLPQGRMQISITAQPPSPERLRPRPLEDPERGENLSSTLDVESNDKEIRALALRLVGEEKDAYAAASRIVSWVARNLSKDYGASADRATDVLRQLKGDCTEHSLLAVALMRAAGIPSRRVDGVVYLVNSDGVPALYWHEWVEAWVGEWTQMDPTFDQQVADATHLALGREGQAEIIQLFGKLRVVEIR